MFWLYRYQPRLLFCTPGLGLGRFGDSVVGGGDVDPFVSAECTSTECAIAVRLFD